MKNILFFLCVVVLSSASLNGAFAGNNAAEASSSQSPAALKWFESRL